MVFFKYSCYIIIGATMRQQWKVGLNRTLELRPPFVFIFQLISLNTNTSASLVLECPGWLEFPLGISLKRLDVYGV